MELTTELEEPQQAMEEMIVRYCDAFSDAYADFQEEKMRKGGILMGSDDLASFVARLRSEYPEKMAVLAILPGAEAHKWRAIPFGWRPALVAAWIVFLLIDLNNGQ